MYIKELKEKILKYSPKLWFLMTYHNISDEEILDNHSQLIIFLENLNENRMSNYSYDLSSGKITWRISPSNEIGKEEARISEIKNNFLFSNYGESEYKIRLNNDWIIQTVERKKILDELFSIQHKKTRKNLWLCGRSGIGKTHMIKALCNDCASKGQKIVFLSMPMIGVALLVQNNYADRNQYLKEIWNASKEADILVFDGIGSESIPPWLRNSFYLPILDYRNVNNLQTIFTSNYTIAQFKTTYKKEIAKFNKNNKSEFSNVSEIATEGIITRIKANVKQIMIKDETEYSSHQKPSNTKKESESLEKSTTILKKSIQLLTQKYLLSANNIKFVENDLSNNSELVLNIESNSLIAHDISDKKILRDIAWKISPKIFYDINTEILNILTKGSKKNKKIVKDISNISEDTIQWQKELCKKSKPERYSILSTNNLKTIISDQNRKKAIKENVQHNFISNEINGTPLISRDDIIGKKKSELLINPKEDFDFSKIIMIFLKNDAIETYLNIKDIDVSINSKKQTLVIKVRYSFESKLVNKKFLVIVKEPKNLIEKLLD